MEIIANAINTTLESFDFAYCISVNVLTYCIINIISSRLGNKDLSTWTKRIVLIVSIVCIGGVHILTGSDVKLILNSSILAPVFWSWVLKPICKKFKIDYKQINLFD